MNSQVRTYLIEKARRNPDPVFYSDIINDCKLPIDLGTPKGQLELKNMLIEISKFENSNNRPLLTSIAIGKKENDHGNGFYELAEELGFGKNKVLHDSYWGMEEMKKSQTFWRNDANYSKYLKEQGSPANQEVPAFFTAEEIEFFRQWQYKAYDKLNDEHVDAKNYLMETVWNKTKYLGQQVQSHFDGFTLDGKRTWSQRGWSEQEDGSNIPAAIFKPYTWVKLYRNTDSGKDIFFTFGLDMYPETEAFVYKIDCQRTRDSKLSQVQIELCKNSIPQSAGWNEIQMDDFLELTWPALISLCVKFVQEHLAQYDAIIATVWEGNSLPAGIFTNQLIWHDKPTDGFETMPERNHSFTGATIDFTAKSKEQKDLGDAGEALVIRFEKEFLKRHNLEDRIDQVVQVKDGKGYDVFSFDEQGNEKYIEVKTTTSGKHTEFYLSENELAYMHKNPGSYHIYRIFNYDHASNVGECFKISNNVKDQLLMAPIQYRVLLKKVESA